MLRTSRGIQNNRRTSETGKGTEYMRNQDPTPVNTNNCAQEVSSPDGPPLVSTVHLTQSCTAESSQGLHSGITPGQLTEGCGSCC